MARERTSTTRAYMTHHDRQAAAVPRHAGDTQATGQVDSAERERLAYALGVRFAPYLQAAAAAVRGAEQVLAETREQLARARRDASSRPYQSDRLVFMRASVKDEVEGLTRKTTPKKVRVAYRYLLDRAVELAEGEVDGYQADQAAARHQREDSVDAWVQAERTAVERLDAARAMQHRVHDAEQAARQGLAVMVDKLAAPPSSEASA